MSHEPWETEASHYVASGRWWRLRRDDVRLSGGRRIEGFTTLECDRWVNVVAVTEDDEVVLIRQYRHPVGRTSLELPGGGCEKDEEPVAAARRELLEETGYGDGHWEPLFVFAPNPGFQDNWTHSFLASGVRRLVDPTPEETEDLVVELHPRQTLRRLIATGEIFHALHLVPLFAYLSEIRVTEDELRQHG